MVGGFGRLDAAVDVMVAVVVDGGQGGADAPRRRSVW